MWIYTTKGFYSVVLTDKGMLMFRARRRRDLENILHAVKLPTDRILQTPHADYAYRVILTRKEFTEILLRLSQDVIYSNFKSSIIDIKRRKIYGKVWSETYELQRDEDTRNIIAAAAAERSQLPTSGAGVSVLQVRGGVRQGVQEGKHGSNRLLPSHPSKNGTGQKLRKKRA